MILEWLAPASAMLLGARLVYLEVRAGWHDWVDILKTAGSVFVAALLVKVGFDVRYSVGATLVLAPLLVAMALVPARRVLRLIGAKRPNEIEDPELFEDGELKPGVEVTGLRDPTRD